MSAASGNMVLEHIWKIPDDSNANLLFTYENKFECIGVAWAS